MNFLKELEGLISNQTNHKNINEEIDRVLDKVRTKLNEQLKNILSKKKQCHRKNR